MQDTKKKTEKRVLLAGVFGPFGVDDQYGRKENVMELFHNQVTREQGLASFRFQHRSFGLYFLAENIPGDVTVLDFPSKDQFKKEIRKGYDIVGISFIAPNFVKAREMARLIREYSPDTEIILGGHGAAIEGVDELIDCDHVVKGEGIRWLRTHLGADPCAPMVHPVLPSAELNMLHGIPVPGVTSSLLVPGVGCVNGCSFCCTSHFFQKEYTPFISTGKALYETCVHIADSRGTDEFFVMDENFLKDRERALELLAEMEANERYFEFQIFSSAEAILAFGLDNLVRLGVTFLWLGVESSSEVGNFAKNKGVNAVELVRELRSRGIMVLASGILFMEHHTPANIDKDIDYMISLEADFVQFMQLIPLPTTTVYLDFKKRGLIRHDLPFEEWHGQHKLNWKHPHFSSEAASSWLKAAFRREYVMNCCSLYRVNESSLRGYKRLAQMGQLDKCLQARKDALAQRVRSWLPGLSAIISHPVNRSEKEKALALKRECEQSFPPTVRSRAEAVGARLAARIWKIRLALKGDSIQPATIVTHYPAEGRSMSPVITAPLEESAFASDVRVQVG